jgi:hypothetical protein
LFALAHEILSFSLVFGKQENLASRYPSSPDGLAWTVTVCRAFIKKDLHGTGKRQHILGPPDGSYDFPKKHAAEASLKAQTNSADPGAQTLSWLLHHSFNFKIKGTVRCKDGRDFLERAH